MEKDQVKAEVEKDSLKVISKNNPVYPVNPV